MKHRTPVMLRAAAGSILMSFVLVPCRGSVAAATSRLAFVTAESRVTFSAWGGKCIGSCQEEKYLPPATGRLVQCSRRHYGKTSHFDDSHLPDREYSKEAGQAREAFSTLARKGRSWRRLGHIVEMATDNSNDESLKEPVQTVADVGCDHGLVTLALALSGKFEQVLGLDVSERALEDGAKSLQQRVLSYIPDNLYEKQGEGTLSGPILPVEFRVGDGLSVVNPGEADAVCIAGMGAHTMLQILQKKSSNGPILDVERVGCKKLFLQPTNSRPRNLMILYDALHDMGWCLSDERIEKLSRRWYISSSFVNQKALKIPEGCGKDLPGSKLLQLDSSSDSMRRIFDEYVEHHQSWIRQEKRAGGRPFEEDARWLEYIRTGGE